jgi:hypothetical protein
MTSSLKILQLKKHASKVLIYTPDVKQIIKKNGEFNPARSIQYLKFMLSDFYYIILM